MCSPSNGYFHKFNNQFKLVKNIQWLGTTWKNKVLWGYLLYCDFWNFLNRLFNFMHSISFFLLVDFFDEILLLIWCLMLLKKHHILTIKIRFLWLKFQTKTWKLFSTKESPLSISLLFNELFHLPSTTTFSMTHLYNSSARISHFLFAQRPSLLYFIGVVDYITRSCSIEHAISHYFHILLVIAEKLGNLITKRRKESKFSLVEIIVAGFAFISVSSILK